MQIPVIKGSSPHPTDDRLQQMVCATLSHCELALAEGRNDRSWCVAVSRQVSVKVRFHGSRQLLWKWISRNFSTPLRLLAINCEPVQKNGMARENMDTILV
ncbi:hypothetical protein TNIN_20981 [Trichonephila inaurata madagascariensis]|uniref:Uncharacterized protein n=1 Tax=Trichonephila inaurata madagascariensis TaxID=2747483 RepID=A0A8X6XYH6_9ARAC|nr:hypothetical protein TNIN_20981 [Trichonephila inaurata madagascariensis]